MRYTLLVTGPAYGTQHASSALLFARALVQAGHLLESVFFYREGVLNANQLTAPANDEVDMVREWQQLRETSGAALNICVAAALRRGVVDAQEAERLQLAASNLQPGFELSGLGALAEAALSCDRLVQFLMNRVAFLFTQAPHGSSAGREGLDAVLAMGALSENIGLFFIGDGVPQLNRQQQPEQILARNYIATFGVLDLYDIDQCFLCADSLRVRGQCLNADRVMSAEVLEALALREKLASYHRIIRF